MSKDTGQRATPPLLPNEIAHLRADQVQVRSEPLRVMWALSGIPAADGHSLNLRFTCGVIAMPQPAEQAMLRETFGSGGAAISVERVMAHFRETLRSELLSTCGSKPAGDWLTDPAGLAEAARSAANRVAFLCGLDLVGPFEIDAQSPSVAAQRADHLQRQAAEARAARQLEHVQRAGAMLREFESIRQSAPALSAGQVLARLSPSDQAATLENLLLASSQEHRTRTIWGCAGNKLIKIDLTAAPPLATVIDAPSAAGPLRSVQVAGGRLVLCAQNGVIVMDPAALEQASSFIAPPATTVTGGYRRAIAWNDRIWAVHGEAGVVAWRMDRPAEPELSFGISDLGGLSPRGLVGLDESRLLVFGRDAVVMLSADGGGEKSHTVLKDKIVPGHTILTVLAESGRFIIVMGRGIAQARDAATLATTWERKVCERAYAAALLPWMGSVRLLISSGDGKVHCVGPDDELSTCYQSTFHGLEDIAAAADLIVGLGANRKRLVIWSPAQPDRPTGQVAMEHLLRDGIGDVAV